MRQVLAILIFSAAVALGNTAGVPEPPCDYRIGSAEDGGTLSGVAKLFYGDETKWEAIYEANPEVLDSPDSVNTTMVVRIPLLEADTPMEEETSESERYEESIPRPLPNTDVYGTRLDQLPSEASEADRYAVTIPEPLPARSAKEGPALASLDAVAIRQLAAEAIAKEYPDVKMDRMDPGYIIYMRHPSGPRNSTIMATWLGQEAFTYQKGDRPDMDRIRVRRLRVKMTPSGEILEVLDDMTWLYRGQTSATR